MQKCAYVIITLSVPSAVLLSIWSPGKHTKEYTFAHMFIDITFVKHDMGKRQNKTQTH